MQKNQRISFWDFLLALGITLFFLNSVVFFVLGRFNADEGWYLYACKLVYAGQLPYRNFAFTQTPLLPYIYGIIQNLFLQSLYLGRATSVFFSILAFLLSLKIAFQYGGKMAGAITSLLGGTFLFGIYYQSIIKTYPLTTLFCLLALFFLSSGYRKEIKLILPVLFVLLAALTRLTATFFAIPFILYALIVADNRIRIIVVALCLAACSWMLIVALPDLDAALWGLMMYHLTQFGNLSLAERTWRIVEITIPRLVEQFPCYFLLMATLVFLGIGRIRAALRSYPATLITVVGLFPFAVANLLTGGFLVEYYVPLLFILFPIIGIAFARLFLRISKRSQIVLQLVVLSALVMGLVRSRFTLYDLSGGQPPIEKIQDVAAVVTKNSGPNDKLFAFEALAVAIESHREAMPNQAMAQFSFSSADTKTADHLHLMNGPMILGDIENGIPKLVILTDLDWEILRGFTDYDSIVAALDQNYRLIYSLENFGQRDNRVEVFLRRIDQ